MTPDDPVTIPAAPTRRLNGRMWPPGDDGPHEPTSPSSARSLRRAPPDRSSTRRYACSSLEFSSVIVIADDVFAEHVTDFAGVRVQPNQLNRPESYVLGRVDGFDQDEAESKRDERAVILRRLLPSKCDTLEAFELAHRLFDACPCLVECFRKEGGHIFDLMLDRYGIAGHIPR
jgi:hypothetical protein